MTFCIVISDLLLEVGVPPPAQRYGAVFIGPVEAARGMSFDAVFIPGLAERLFPRKIVEDPIILDSLRTELNAGLATNEQRLAQERLALGIAVGAAERRLYLSYPRLDLQQGRPRVPSFYALEAVRAAEGRLPNFTELDRRAEAESSARIGWPAPDDPAEAIDHAEYDLAVLARFLNSDPGQSQGTARYLLTTNSYLGRALRNRWQKWSPQWTPADGLVKASAASQSAIAKHALGMRSYSPTALQNYAACPYKFFLQAIHRLAPREVPEAIDELDPLQRGSLIHEIQFELFERLKAANLLPISRQNLERVAQLCSMRLSEKSLVNSTRILRRRSIGCGTTALIPSGWIYASGSAAQVKMIQATCLGGLSFPSDLPTAVHKGGRPIRIRPPSRSISTAAFSSAGRSTSSNVTRAGTFGSATTKPARLTEKTGRSSRAENPCSQRFMRWSLKSSFAES